MFRRRRREADGAADETGTETIATEPDATEPDATASDEDARQSSDVEAEPEAAPKSERADGPWDAAEVDVAEPSPVGPRVDLGGLLVPRPEGGALQVQVEERTGRATSVMVVFPDAAVQLLAVAAPRSSGLWPQTRVQIAADATRRGGSATEAHGPLGTEVRVVVPATLPDGTQGRQPSRVVGIDGPRWMLRATFLGKAVNDAAVFGRLAALVKAVVVVRGDGPMAPGDLLPLTVPPGAVPQAGRGAAPPQPPARG
ncbi:MAG TPA: DUF3710 domain-containing protein [Jiangellales bacterium]|nr:DUF3710 domain-containing protein [Jiangellales bacterium]